MRERIRDIIRRSCAEMGVHIVKGVLSRDHVHMFLSIPPQLALSTVMRRIKGRSTRRIQMEFPELRKQLWVGELWNDGYFVRSVGDKVTADIIRKYIEYQTHEDDSIQLNMFGNP